MDDSNPIQSDSTGKQDNAPLDSGVPVDPIEPHDGGRAPAVDETKKAPEKANHASECPKACHQQLLNRAGEVWMIIFTAIVAFTTVAQFLQSGFNNRSTAKQVDRIIGAANTQACAANKIAAAAKKSAQAAADFATYAKGINDHTSDAVGQFKRLADATKSAAGTAKDTLHISERAYISVVDTAFDSGMKALTLTIINSGHIPSGDVTLTLYEATLNKNLPDILTVNDIIERHKSINLLSPLVPSVPTYEKIPAPEMLADLINSGHQVVLVTGTISYSDGFPDSPLQHISVCVSSVYHTVLKQTFISNCDVKKVLPELEALDWKGFTTTFP